jgi:hypothetical protein
MAASRFYNPLQERISSDKRAMLEGEDPLMWREIFYQTENETIKFLIINYFSSFKNKFFVC